MTHFCQHAGASVVMEALGDDHVCLNPLIQELTNPTQLFEHAFPSLLVCTRSFCLGIELRPVSGAPRDDTCDTHHAAASYPQQQPCTRLEAQRQDRPVRSRHRVSKTELRGSFAIPSRSLRAGPGGAGGADLSDHCLSPQPRFRPRWPWESTW